MAKRRKKVKLPSAEELGLLDCMKSANGRAFLWDLLGTAGVFRMSYTAQSPSHTFFREGERSQGNRLLARIQAADPEGYLKMQREAFERTKQREHANESRRAAEYGPPAGDGDGTDDGDGDEGHEGN